VRAVMIERVDQSRCR